MKKGWEYKRIKDIGTVIAGTTPNTNVAEYWNGNLCWISPAELDGSHYLYDSRKKITEAAVKAKSLRLLPEGTVILSSRAPIGKVVINKIPTYCNQGFKCVVCGKEVYNEFLFWWFWGKTEYLNSLGTGATFKEISKKVVEEILIPVPPLSEQQRIVDYLDAAFAKIDAMKANAEKALGEAKALFQASLKEMMEPKEGWEEKTLGDLVVSNVVGLTRGKVEQGYDKKYPYFKMNNISPDNTLCWDDLICVDANEEELEKYCLQEGDFLFNTRNSKEWVGKSAVYRNFDTSVMLFNNNIMRIRFVDTINPIFIAYSFLADYTKNQIEKIKSGTTNVWAIYYRDLSKILLTFPPLSEQQRIVATLDSLKSKVDRLQANFAKLSQECDALKQAILRQVFE